MFSGTVLSSSRELDIVMMGTGQIPPSSGRNSSPALRKKRVLGVEVQERVQTHAKVRVKRKVY